MLTRNWLIGIIALFLLCPAYSRVCALDCRVDWEKFLSRQDPVWEQLPRQWNEGAFTGNGQLGIMLYQAYPENVLEFQLGRADVTDHRKAPDRKSSIGLRGANAMFDFCRLDIGKLQLRPAGKIRGGTVRMDLWNAETRAEVFTDRGVLRLRILTLRDRMVQLIEVKSSEKDAAGKYLPWKWEFIPGNADSPRAQVNPEQAKERKYQSNPVHEFTSIDNIFVCVQPLLAGGDYATAWYEVKDNRENRGVLYVSTANEIPAAGKSAGKAAADIKATAAQPLDKLLEEHRRWWHEFYPAAFLSVPDPRLEAFYWIQIYKLASAWREDAPAIDLCGPWFRITAWPGIWWNLNIQLTYLPVYAGNRLEIGENFRQLLAWMQQSGALENAAKGTQIGDYAWALHCEWLHLRYAGDWKKIVSEWMPRAKILADAYLRRVKVRPDGRYSLPRMGSPEYNGFKPYDDTNYNLALLHWLLGALAEAGEKGGIDAAEISRWREAEEKLADYPVDKNGLMIGRDQALDMSHRHFSHLLALYPLYQLNPDKPEDRDLLIRSLRHWHKIEGGKRLAGYSFTGGASLYASLGMGREALEMLQDYLDNTAPISRALPNTMYCESGGKNPVIETPLHGAAAIMDLLIQSWGGKIRVFPALPPEWKNAEFCHLRAMGGFLVSAKLKNGNVEWVEITSEAGEPCTVYVPAWKGVAVEAGGKKFSTGEIALDLKKGETVLLRRAGGTVPAVIDGTASVSANPFGVKKGGGIPPGQFYKTAPKQR